MFGVVRLVFWVGLLFVGLFVMNKSKLSHKKQYVIAIGIIIIVLWVLSNLIPIENFFVTFSSPEDAFNYVNSEDVKLVIQGKNSDFVIGERDSTNFVYMIIPKNENGWKIGRGLDTKLRMQKMHNGIFINVYQYKNTGDYYLVVSGASGSKLQIKDSLDSQFLYFENINNKTSETYITYYASIFKIDAQYWINIDGEEIHLFNE